MMPSDSVGQKEANLDFHDAISKESRFYPGLSLAHKMHTKDKYIYGGREHNTLSSVAPACTMN